MNVKRGILLSFLCLAGALLDICINQIIWNVMNIPLYMDTILNISITFLFGPIWGALTGFLSTFIFNSWPGNFWGWEAYLFAICSIATSIITWLFMRFFPGELCLERTNKFYPNSRRLEGIINRMIVLMLLSFVLCIAMSILGGLISYFIEYLRTSGEVTAVNNPSAVPTMLQIEIPPILGAVLSRFPVNIIDRLISAFAGFGIAFGLRGIGERIMSRKQER